MHDDGARTRVIVEAGIESIHAQRIAVAALVGLGGAEQAQAGGVAAVLVGEALRDVVAGAGTITTAIPTAAATRIHSCQDVNCHRDRIAEGNSISDTIGECDSSREDIDRVVQE